jgi:hypothetical protein
MRSRYLKSDPAVGLDAACPVDLTSIEPTLMNG